MFFRRQRHIEPTFQQRLESARQAGFQVAPLDGGGAEISRDAFTARFEERGGRIVRGGRAGLKMGGETALLVDAGFQKFFRTPSGREQPARAEDLARLHAFEEDLKETLGLTSLYNESLGTVSAYYLYDRLTDRDRGVPKRVWEE